MEVYLHVKVFLGLILGLGIAHLLRGIALILQHPEKNKAYWVHLAWTLFLFLYLIHFWWWEFSLARIEHWTFPLYFFFIFYATLAYLICTLLFPDRITEYSGYRDYFYSRKNWFFALMVLLFLADIADTFLKGPAYRHALGISYDIRTALFLLLGLFAIWSKSPLFHSIFVVFANIYEIFYILNRYLTLG